MLLAGDAWGYILEGRTYESKEGKFKFTGKERDKESFYDYFGARYYDAKIGRWGQVEPLLDKYINVSPYCYGLNNPIYLLDIDGMDLFVGGDKTAALNDLKSLFSDVEIQNRISADDNGSVSFDVIGLDLTSDAALELLNSLVTSENKFLFEVSNTTIEVNRKNGEVINYDLSDQGYQNLSKTPRSIDNPDFLPRDGFDGQVTIGTGYFLIPTPHKKSDIKDDRWNTVFHELAENYFRTEKGEPYMRNDKAKSGAHSMAIDWHQRFRRNTSINPGSVGGYIP
ncbi:MAG: RHS repeat-associated core domain-containing protein [Ignavibacteriae bacterium]|nr:RHS repeat-associated core domain-containing protein [Ignavibacteriota bacterium]